MVLKIVIVLFLCVVIKLSDALMCYQCSDSSDAKGKNACQTFARTMIHYRKEFLKKGELTKYVKNCTEHKQHPDDDVFCVVMKVSHIDSVKSYIRDCSDGRTFFGDDYDINLKSKVEPDNQTSCINSGTDDLRCVTLCGADPGNPNDTGDFCNGPSIGGASSLLVSFKMVVAILCIISVCTQFS